MHMKLFEYIDRINLLHKLIKEKKTGTLDELSKRMNLSRSHMCRVLEDLKLKGAPIVYDRQLSSYTYTQKYQIKIDVEFKVLSEEETRNTNGGSYVCQISCRKFLHCFF